MTESGDYNGISAKPLAADLTVVCGNYRAVIGTGGRRLNGFCLTRNVTERLMILILYVSTFLANVSCVATVGASCIVALQHPIVFAFADSFYFVVF